MLRITLWLGRDEDGRQTLLSDYQLPPDHPDYKPSRIAPVRPRGPCRDYALERAWARENKKRRDRA